MALASQEPVSAPMRRAIQQRLEQIRAEENARILLAVESGSRAWGFWSPDSDYDVRFVYVRDAQDYLSIEPPRDVIERPISDELDFAGWDLAKTLKLIFKSNAVILEWLQSPIHYGGDDAFASAILDFARPRLDEKALAYHYLNLARSQINRFLDDPALVRGKKYFYVIRPALTLRWLRLHGATAVPPMDFGRLTRETCLPDAILETLAGLLEQKKKEREFGLIPRNPALDALIHAEVQDGEQRARRPAQRKSANDIEAADAFLRTWIHNAA
ncbi:nucleotidyltransferase domain-containing protein [Labrys sp. WJW]|uniref:nucleotidyltransferase domain-containing protein n=1 Tax=unclassified Labrys (in: a-proteobacteria) TaxID=2688601 RepID=UPI0009ECC8C4|nr:nucleotidyltransferase domain-containing protein [Labrys sp. WJW]